MADDDKDHTFKLVLLIVIILLPVFLFICLFAALGLINVTDGCLRRYTADVENSQKINPDALSDSRVETMIIRADGNYKTTPEDPNKYGQWLQTKFYLKKNEKLALEIYGEVSLCKAKSIKNANIDIPRAETSNLTVKLCKKENLDNLSPMEKLYCKKNTNSANSSNDEPKAYSDFYTYGLPVILKAEDSRNWVDVASLDVLDKIEVRIKPTVTSIIGNIGFSNNPENTEELDFSNASNIKDASLITANCSERQTSYSPICGRFTPYSDLTFATSCFYESKWARCQRINKSSDYVVNYDCLKEYIEKAKSWISTLCGVFTKSKLKECEVIETLKKFEAELVTTKFSSLKSSSFVPKPYLDDKTYTFPQVCSLSELQNMVVNLNGMQCNNGKDYYSNPEIASWFTQGQGLVYRIDKDGDEKVVKSLQELTLSDQPNDYPTLYSGQINLPPYSTLKDLAKANPYYGKLQFKFFHPNSQRGGYVINIKQTKCVRQHGVEVGSTGALEYIISNTEPSIDTKGKKVEVQKLKSSSNTEATIKAENEGYLFLRIDNRAEDYKDSYGSYQVKLIHTTKLTDFINYVDMIIRTMKDTETKSSNAALRNLTCYQQTDKSPCINFFNYIRAILAMYVIYYGIKIILDARISIEDGVTHLIKMIIVAGLINENTLVFFDEYVKNIVWEYTDTMIANLSGYDVQEIANKGGQVLTSPMYFLNSLLTKIFLSKTFLAQIFATLSAGLPGIFYFILVIVALSVFLISAFRAISVYTFSFLSVGVLINTAPIFLSYMLLEKTNYLFENWLRALIRCIFEPLILLAGLILITQLFEMYLDFTVGYSVCWKCAIPIKLPFSDTIGIIVKLAKHPVFCISWFAPWGTDPVSNDITFSLANFVILLLISYCAYTYIKLASSITNTIFGSQGSSASGSTNNIFKKMGGKVQEAAKEAGKQFF